MTTLPSPTSSRSLIVTSACALALTACGVTVQGGNTGGGGSASTSTTTGTTTSINSTSTSTTGTSTGSTGTSSGSAACPGLPATPPLTGPCAPSPSCGVGSSVCLAHVSQAGSTKPGFRMSQLTFTKPDAFTKGIVKSVIGNTVLPSDVACSLTGAATFSWLLRVDIAAGTVTTGGAKPASSPSSPYTFVDEVVSAAGTNHHVKPVTAPGTLSPGCMFAADVGDVLLPMYLDDFGTMLALLPFRGLQFHDVAVSADLGCIGRYNAEGLQVANACQPDSQNLPFQNAGALESYITLEDADTTVIGLLNETLCVVLSGDPSTFGVLNIDGLTVCKRDASNEILVQGDWCASTNAPASGGCKDAMKASATFAAQAASIQ